jgi:putative zinc finger protein
MNCTPFRERLPELLYNNLPSADASAIQAHLIACLGCRHEFAELERARQALDIVAVPSITVDISRLMQQAAALDQRRARRWRRATLTVCGLAAALLLVVLLRMEIRFDAHQLVLRWGSAPPPEAHQNPPPEPSVIVQREIVSSPDVEEQLRVIRDTLHALAGSLDTRDIQLRQTLGQLETRLETLRLQDGRRWNDTERNVAALYKAVFILPNRGERQ